MISIIKKFTKSPRTFFLMDSLGALVTAFFIFAILRTFKEYVEMPQKVLTILSIIAVMFSLYSITCYFLLTKNWQLFLRTISIANLLYCFLTMGLVIYYYQSLTILGLTYFLIEMVVFGGLIFVELKVSGKCKDQ